MASPAIPAEGTYSNVELSFIEKSPPGLWPENQDSYFGQLRKVICDEIQSWVDLMMTLYQEMFPATAGSYISLWEEEVGLPVAPTGKTLQDRRTLVQPRRYYGPFTRGRRNAIIEQYILPTLGGDAATLTPGGLDLSAGVPLYSGVSSLTGTYAVVESVTTFSFTIRIKNTITPDEAGLRKELDRVVPAGLSYSIVYVAVP